MFQIAAPSPTARKHVVRALQLLFIAGAAALAYSYVASARDGELRKSCTSVCAMAPAYAGADRVAPNFELTTMDGASFRLDSKRGKTVVLAFWNTTCDSCKQQMSGLRALADIARGEPWLEILAVAVDESPAEVAAVLRQHTGVENPFPVALDPESSVVQRLFDTTMFPETWVIDPSGMVRMRFDGPRDWGAPIAVELLRNISRGSMCPLQVASTADAPIGDGPVARGPGAAICGEYTR